MKNQAPSRSISRRGFLRASALGAIAISLPSCTPPRVSRPDLDYETVVVGAGIAGLAAARQLQRKGRRVLVVEARKRIGGRIWTSNNWTDAPVDLGASWIHGADGNPLMDLFGVSDMKSVETNGDSTTVFSSAGSVLSEEEYSQLEVVERRVWHTLEKFAKSSLHDISVREAVERELNTQLLSSTERDMLEYQLNEIEQEYSGSASDLSARYFDIDETTPGPDILLSEGYAQVTSILAKDLIIRTGAAVSRIERDNANDNVRVHASGEIIRCSNVIVTLPLGVLKQGDIEFNPSLPTNKVKAIRSLGYGLLDKCYLRFEERFWDRTDWITSMSGVDTPGEWNQWVNLEPASQRPILLGFNAANYAMALQDRPDTEVVAEAMQRLRRMYGKAIPEPTCFQVTRWGSDPYARGSYSYWKVGCESDTREQLARPVDGWLFFAGEATHDTFPSTVHGAYLSGIRAAEEAWSDL